jgi:hypothetical protein
LAFSILSLAFSSLSCSVSLLICSVSFLSSCARILDSAILLSTSGSRRQLSNCFAEACGYVSHNRQRGSDEPDAPLLIEGEAAGADVDVVISGIQSNQANHQTAQELNPGLAVETKKTQASMH